MFQFQRQAVGGRVGLDTAAACPTVVVGRSWNGISRGGGCEHIHNQCLVVAFQRKVHFPIVFGRPVPVDDILAILIPAELHLFPQLVNLFCQFLFLLVTVAEVLAHAKQALHQEAAFHQVAAIVLLSERLHLSGRTVQPVGPYAVEAVGAFQIIGNLGQALHAFGSGDKATLYTYQQTGNTESAATDGDDALVFLGIFSV